MELHLPETLTFFIHMVFIRAEGPWGRDLICLSACKKHTRENNDSVLSVVLGMTQTSFPSSLCCISTVCKNNKTNKREINRSFPCQQTFPEFLFLTSEVPWKLGKDYRYSLCAARARHCSDQRQYQTVKCYTQMQDKVLHPKELIFLS